MKRHLILIAGALLITGFASVACGDDDDDGGASSAVGPGITIAQALDSDLDEPLLVNGFLVASGEEVLLCEALAESFPPQCGGDSLLVEGLDLASIDGLQDEGEVR